MAPGCLVSEGRAGVGVFDCSTTAVNLNKSIFSGLHSL